MYVIDIRHYLGPKGDIAPPRGPARRLAEFVAAVVAHASDFDRPDAPGPVCFKCRKVAVQTTLADDDTIGWHCPRCGTEGVISNWQQTFWDLSSGSPHD